MNREEFLAFESVFGLRESIFNGREWPVAKLVYRVACDELRKEEIDAHDNESDDNSDSELSDGHDYYDDDSVLSLHDLMLIKYAIDNFKRVIELLDLSSYAKSVFLGSFDQWSSYRESNIQRFNEIVEEIQNWKMGTDIAKGSGSATAAVGGALCILSFVPPLAAFTRPLLITGTATGAAGSLVNLGACGINSLLLKNKLEEFETRVTVDESTFSKIVKPWFVHTKDLKKAIESLVSYSLLKEMSKDLQDFRGVDWMDLSAGGFVVNRFKQALKLCIWKMRRLSNIMRSFDVVITPAVMTFVIVVCLLRYGNWNVLDCAMQTDRLEKSRRFTTGRDRDCITQKNCLVSVGLGVVIVGIAIEIVNVVRASIDIYNRPKVEEAEKMKDAAELLEEEFEFVKSIFDELEADELSLSYEDIVEITGRCDLPEFCGFH